MVKMLLKLSGGVLFFIGLSLLIWQLLPTEPLIEPSTTTHQIAQPTLPDQTIEVMAFLPYWFVSKTESIPAPITSLAYFGLAVSPEGMLSLPAQKKEPWWRTLESAHYHQLNQTLQQTNLAHPVVITNFDTEEITQLLRAPAAQQQFFTELDKIMKLYSFTGVIIDFEPASAVDAQLQQDFTTFIAQLKQHLGQQQTLDIAVYGNAIAGTNLWNIGQLSDHTDRFIIMMYDFHRKSSNQAGALAPLTQKDTQGTAVSITPLLKNYLAATQREKILLGIPFYGYEWQTVAATPNANTYPRSSRTVWQKDIITLLNDDTLNATPFWDDASLSTFLLYNQKQKSYVISFESWLSLDYKMFLVKQLQLGGIAIWSLGYERENDPLWQEISPQQFLE